MQRSTRLLALLLRPTLALPSAHPPLAVKLRYGLPLASRASAFPKPARAMPLLHLLPSLPIGAPQWWCCRYYEGWSPQLRAAAATATLAPCFFVHAPFVCQPDSHRDASIAYKLLSHPSYVVLGPVVGPLTYPHDDGDEKNEKRGDAAAAERAEIATTAVPVPCLSFLPACSLETRRCIQLIAVAAAAATEVVADASPSYCARRYGLPKRY